VFIKKKEEKKHVYVVCVLTDLRLFYEIAFVTGQKLLVKNLKFLFLFKINYFNIFELF
jgi:hypothetical protein